MKKAFFISLIFTLFCISFSSDIITGSSDTDFFQSDSDISTPGPDNAHWQLKPDADTGSKVARCRKDTENNYGFNDFAVLSNVTPIDLSFYSTATLYLQSKLENADSGDYGELYINDDHIATFNSYHEWTDYSYNLDSYCSGSITIKFVWKSDSSGVDKGWRIEDVQVIAYGTGAADWQQVLYWDEDHSPYSGETVQLDISGWSSGINPSRVNFHYYDDSEWAWFAQVDNVHIYDNTKADLLATEEFEGSFPPSGWSVTENGDTDGIWRLNSFWSRTNWTGGNGSCADADSDGFGGGGLLMDTELISPDINCSGSTTVTLEFDIAYNDINLGDYFEIMVWSSYYVDEVFYEDFNEDLSNWNNEDLAPIQSTSLGSIKSLFSE